MRPIHIEVTHLRVGTIGQCNRVIACNDDLVRVEQIRVVRIIAYIYKIDVHLILGDFVINLTRSGIVRICPKACDLRHLIGCDGEFLWRPVNRVATEGNRSFRVQVETIIHDAVQLKIKVNLNRRCRKVDILASTGGVVHIVYRNLSIRSIGLNPAVTPSCLLHPSLLAIFNFVGMIHFPLILPFLQNLTRLFLVPAVRGAHHNVLITRHVQDRAFEGTITLKNILNRGH